MQFNHVIEVEMTTSSDGMTVSLTRDQIWRGLVLRAERPTLFISYLDECLIRDRSEQSLSRTLRYGNTFIHDEVHFVPQHSIHYVIAAQNDVHESRLLVTIEEPQPGAFCVRFEYEDTQTSAPVEMDAALYEHIRHSAYKESDTEAIELIQQWVTQNKLDSLSNK